MMLLDILDVIAYLTGRGEMEITMLPEDVVL